MRRIPVAAAIGNNPGREAEGPENNQGHVRDLDWIRHRRLSNSALWTSRRRRSLHRSGCSCYSFRAIVGGFGVARLPGVDML